MALHSLSASEFLRAIYRVTFFSALRAVSSATASQGQCFSPSPIPAHQLLSGSLLIALRALSVLNRALHSDQG
eukprot:1157652-Pelagomonas_calceolata.AAC.8